jgi:hypothetical protein
MKKIINYFKSLLIKFKILKAPEPAAPKKIEQLTPKEKTKLIEQLRKKQGWLSCFECGRSAGLRYKYSNGKSRGIILRKISPGIYVCEDCIHKKAI